MILFVCVGNAARSQIAEAFFNKLSPKDKAISAGIKPASRVSSKAIEVMKEAGIDISSQKPKQLTNDMVKKAAKIITMGCLEDEACPVFLIENKSKIEDWTLEDPKDKPIEKVREIRDEIKKRVETLVKKQELNIS